MGFDLIDFVKESNRIEGIMRWPTVEEIQAHDHFLDLESPTLEDMERFVKTVASADLRRHSGMDVRVGKHIPMKGGQELEWVMREFFIPENLALHTPHETHIRYKLIHPFMDGNGRSGRLLWLWKMGGIDNAPLGFLHHFYYQTLGARQ